MQEKNTDGIDNNIFYCVFENGRQNTVIAENEKQIEGAEFVISLSEIIKIKEILEMAKIGVMHKDSKIQDLRKSIIDEK